MRINAVENEEAVDIIVSGDTYRVRLVGERAANVKKLLEEALDVDLLALESGKELDLGLVGGVDDGTIVARGLRALVAIEVALFMVLP